MDPGGMSLHLKIGLVASLFGTLLLTGCGSSLPGSTPTVTVTSTPSAKVVIFNPATSGKVLAARLAARAKPKNPADKITKVECRNFANVEVGTHTDCQMRVNGVKRGFRATFTQRAGHYSVTSQKLTW
ncbi:MAG: hypothetical protein QOE58_2915 [Actinomycetota bacterium]|jgi:hypothetical protein|nr:hypothetical protein [Actinomycetota bacterium]